MRFVLPSAALLSVILAPSLAAQDVASLCEQVRQIEVGQWAEYQLTSKQAPGPATMRFAIVGTERVNATEHYWYELKIGGPQGTMITQLLVAGYPYHQGDVQAMVMKMGDQPAMKMPAQMMAMMQNRMGENRTLDMAKECGKAQTIGWETVTVPAGSFRTLHLRPADGEGEAWVSTKIPFGLVKFSGKDGEITLQGYGDGAESSIKESPREMPGG